MLNRYDTTQQSRVDCEFARKYDTAQNAFTDCEFVRAYDASSASWIDKLKKFMEVSVDNHFYDNAGNMVFCSEGLFHCDVSPTYRTYEINFTLKENFTNPVISCLYSFGHSDLCPNIHPDFLSHACVDWEVRGIKDGALVAAQGLASGNTYAYEKVFDQSKEITLTGTFDEIRLICIVHSFSNYANYNRANTTIDNFSINGKSYSAKSQAISA